MPRIKRPVSKKSKGEASSSSMELPPQGHPLAHWFQNMSDFNNYSTNFAPRKLISPRYMEANFFQKHDYPILLECLVRQVNLTFKLGKDSYSVDSSQLMEVWKLDFSGHTLILSISQIEHHYAYSRQEACAMFNIPFNISKPTVGHLSIEHRLIHYLITYVLVPRLHNHGLILEEDLEIMWRMATGKKINWVILIASHMQRTKGGKTSKGLPYAILWTKVFEYVGIGLSQAKKKKLEYNHCIDNHVINHMKREQAQDQGMEEAQAMEEEQEAQAPPQPSQAQEPSMSAIMEILQRMELNQQSLHQRFDTCQQEQGRINQRIRRMEAYLYSEDENEDEDQD
ncbi:hypothetical protein PIB30_096605 [Stylosanthes scabra]|uniref:Uncharacterized protein n=1 Tax=Stylosanthes scabra TaxID=79078 RepID=A0ABU6SWE8_9FABA|nr:hypothetical protein [Stylosanthes scabra]